MQNLMSSSVDLKLGASVVGSTIAVSYALELAASQGMGILPIPYITTAGNVIAPITAGVAIGYFVHNSYMSPVVTAAISGAGAGAAIFGVGDIKAPLMLGAAAGASLWLGQTVRGMMS